ncbi:MAG: hypothetical protein KDC83_09220 [Flavobacteriales bacterium]|nr:hypothetical protein [Flavobacteriales bacterium]
MIRCTTILFCVFLVACKGNKEVPAAAEEIKTAPAQKAKAKGLVDFKAHFHLYSPYCGGAAPSEEMEELRRKGSNYSAENVIFIHVESQKEYEFQTDENGDVELSLPLGNYLIFSQGKRSQAKIEEYKKNNWNFDEECLAKYLAESDHKLEVTSETGDQVFRVNKRCFYEGPIPCTTNDITPPP